MIMATPAQRRYLQASAQLASAGEHASPAASSAYELMLVKLDNDRRRLKTIKSMERRLEVKREILPEYQDWVTGVLADGKGAQDDVLTTVMIWAIDVGEYEQALDIGQYVLAHNLNLPDQYERDAATALVDELSNAALAAQQRDIPFETIVLERLRVLVDGRDIHDSALAKLHKALGTQYKTEQHLEEAIRQFKRALELDARAGCKRDLQEAEKQLKEQSRAQAS